MPNNIEKTVVINSKKASCSACRFWRQEGRDKRIGVCVDAVERARKVVPFAINLEAPLVFGYGGKDCPCFESNAYLSEPIGADNETVPSAGATE